jgi:release factor glutamine methyltransferase
LSQIQELFLKGKSLLENISHPDLEAKLLLLKCVSLTEEQFYTSPDYKLSRVQEKRFYKLISRRLAGYPLPYLTGLKEFWSIPFSVFPGVLIPRPETELIVEKTIELSSQGDETIVDIGTGCGNIAISLARELPKARIVATDTSKKALKTARSNAFKQQIPVIRFARGNLFAPLRRLCLERKCDFIVSNPPYVSKEEWAKLPEEIKNHEPKGALVAGKSGLEIIKKLVQGAFLYLKPGGYFLVEIGFGQEEKVLSFFNPSWEEVIFFKDLAGISRLALGKIPS